MTANTGWLVLLIGGHSGAGKSTLATEIARRTGATHVQVDDIRLAIQRVTTPEQIPALHYFASAPGVPRPGVWDRDPDVLTNAMIGVANVASRALGPVIGHHVYARMPVVIEGDGILPGLHIAGTGWNPPANVTLGDVASLVRPIFLIEPDQAVVRSRMGQGPHGDTQGVMHWGFGQWLCAEAVRLGVPVVEPRPYETLIDRVLAEVGPAQITLPG
jgi:hypothetical protein